MGAGPADKGLDTFKTLVYDPLIDVVVKKIIASASFLSFGPIAFIITAVVGLVADKIYAALKEIINFQYVLLLNEQHHAAFVEANQSLRKIAKEKGIDSEEYRNARSKRRSALAIFARYSGT